MNGLIPKRSCVNPVLITTFGLEPSGHKIMRVNERRPGSEATEGEKRQKGRRSRPKRVGFLYSIW